MKPGGAGSSTADAIGTGAGNEALGSSHPGCIPGDAVACVTCLSALGLAPWPPATLHPLNAHRSHPSYGVPAFPLNHCLPACAPVTLKQVPLEVVTLAAQVRADIRSMSPEISVDIYRSTDIYRHLQIYRSTDIYRSKYIYRHLQIYRSTNIYRSKYIYRHLQIYRSTDIYRSKYIYRHLQMSKISKQ